MATSSLIWDEKAQQLWHTFVQDLHLSQVQSDQCRRYIELLVDWNQRVNLTRIVTIPEIIHYHLRDSLLIDQHASFQHGQTICDVGSGAGFPGIPLAIKRSDIQVILLEVNQKKVAFLRHVIESLALHHVHVISDDWRTLLRKAPVPIDWFLARASLEMDELMRLFKPGCVYRAAHLVYWASDQWQLHEAEKPFFIRKEAYTVGLARRWYVFFGDTTHKTE